MASFLQIFAPIGDVFRYVFYLPVYNILMALYQAIAHVFPGGAFAISIIVLTLLLRGAMIPLTRKQLRSSRAMQELQPRLKELQARYGKNDPQGLMQAQQALYKEHGVNPISGCLPLLIQMPFIYALYDSFFTALKPASATQTAAQQLSRINGDLYPFVPHLARLPLTDFFWTNLAAPD
ncbi:MAG: membrane protein insertase YidC, partial [Ktedonobacterales bacterium]|nr:membrane protein insertase YidC [Ktedonobacterales bacterium]